MQFLQQILRPEDVAFEFGSGNSSLWLSTKVSRVLSVESDAAWATEVRATAPGNVELVTASLHDSNEYLDMWDRHGATATIAIVDGRRRVECVERILRSPNRLRWLILDDADRERYESAVKGLRSQALESWVFEGITPGEFVMTSTLFGRLRADMLDS